MQTCPGCGEESHDWFRLCGYCGSILVAQPAPGEVRKTVTVVFCNLKGSTELGDQLDSEVLREVLALYFSAMKPVLERHGGTIEKYIGDTIMAFFGLPRMHEDDALRAVRAAAEMRAALAELNVTLRAGFGVTLENRTGVNTGEVVTGDTGGSRRLATGDTVNVAARLEQAAPVGEVLIGESTYRLVRDAVEVVPVEPVGLEGKPGPVPAYRLLSVAAGARGAKPADLPLVGRAREIAALGAEFRRSVAGSECRLVTLVGEAGVGKSGSSRSSCGASRARRRCCGGVACPTATASRSGRWLRYSGRRPGSCRRTARRTPAPGSRPASASGWPTQLAASSRSWAARSSNTGRTSCPGPCGRSLRSWPGVGRWWWFSTTFTGRRRPSSISSRNSSTPCSARRFSWSARPGMSSSRTGRVSPRGDGWRLRSSSGNSPEPERPGGAEPARRGEPARPLGRRILGLAEGNPLFIEQMLSMLIDDGLLRQQAGRWVFSGAAEAVSVPGNVSSLLGARLDRLGLAERVAVETASVIGLEFSTGALSALAEEGDARAGIEPALAALCRKQLIRPAEPGAADDFGFSHILVRDTAYARLLKRTRARLHERFAAWLTDTFRSRLAEYEEILGYHLEQSFRYRADLGPVDDHGRRLGAEASGHLGFAGRRALARGDMPAAANLLQRAAGLLLEKDPPGAAAPRGLARRRSTSASSSGPSRS